MEPVDPQANPHQPADKPAPDSGFNLSDWAIKHKTLVTYFMLISLIAGAFSYLSLGREEDPPFTIKLMVVGFQWPGATTDETITQVTDRVERKLQELPHLASVRSYTKPGESVVMVEFSEATPPKIVPDLFYQTRKKIDDIRGEFPNGVIGPKINDEFGDSFGVIYAFTSDGFSYRELKDRVEYVRHELLKVKDVGKTDLLGVQDERIYLEFSVRRLAGLGFDRQAALASIQAQNVITPAGVIETDEERILVRVSGHYRSEEDLMKINLRANDRFFRLGDVAEIRRGYAEPSQPLFRYNGQPAIGLAISMNAGGNVLKFGKELQKQMDKIIADLPIGIGVHEVAFQPKVVTNSINGFTKALAEAVVIVLVVSFLSLGIRAGLVVALSIPLVLAITFVVMDMMGVTLQRISLGALIISLGLLVDDAMITVEMMISKLEQGFDRISAATFAYSSTAFPMLTGTLVTVAGFLPVGFAKSGAGEYCFSLFVVVGISLMASWIVAVVFSPLLGVWLLPKNVGGHSHGPGRIERAYKPMVRLCMRFKWTTVAATFGLFALSIYGFGFVQQQFFPSSDRPELLVDLTLPQNSSIHATTKMVDRLETHLKDDVDISHWSSYIGQGAIRFYLPMDVQLAHDFFGQLVLVTKDIEARERVKQKIEKLFATDEFAELVGKVSALDNGPPSGWPVQFRVSGDDPQKVRHFAHQVAETLSQHPSIGQIVFDWNEPAKTLRLQVNQDAARLLGVSSESMARSINTVVSGRVLTSVNDDIYSIDVVLRAREEDRGSIETLRTLQILLDDGRSVPLNQVVTFEYGLEQPLVWRRDRLPAISVKATHANNIQPATIVKDLQPKIDLIKAQMPAGFGIQLGGAVENAAKGNSSLAAVVPMMMFVMVTLLMIQLQSFSRLLLVFSVAPLGLIGVVAALLPSGTPMGFVAILGCIALIGMIIRNSVILIDQVERNIDAGQDPYDAVIDASTHRLRPILLTAAAAILGMIPIAGEVFWGPMAYAVMGGLAVATILTLLFLPALYVTWFRIKPKVA